MAGLRGGIGAFTVPKFVGRDGGMGAGADAVGGCTACIGCPALGVMSLGLSAVMSTFVPVPVGAGGLGGTGGLGGVREANIGKLVIGVDDRGPAVGRPVFSPRMFGATVP